MSLACSIKERELLRWLRDNYVAKSQAEATVLTSRSLYGVQPTAEEIGRCNPDKKWPWTEIGTRVDAMLEDLERRGFCKQIGDSATGRYWEITNNGRDEVEDQP